MRNGPPVPANATSVSLIRRRSRRSRKDKSDAKRVGSIVRVVLQPGRRAALSPGVAGVNRAPVRLMVTPLRHETLPIRLPSPSVLCDPGGRGPRMPDLSTKRGIRRARHRLGVPRSRPHLENFQRLRRGGGTTPSRHCEERVRTLSCRWRRARGESQQEAGRGGCHRTPDFFPEEGLGRIPKAVVLPRSLPCCPAGAVTMPVGSRKKQRLAFSLR